MGSPEMIRTLPAAAVRLRIHARVVSHAWGAAALLALVSCGGGDDPPPPPNNAPTAEVASVPVVPVGRSVTLDAAASSDADGDPLTYAWVLKSKPAGSASLLIDATAARPSFVPDRAGTYSVSLTVDDGTDTSPAATVDVVVADPLLPTKVVAIGSTARTVSQHAPIDTAFQVRVTNVFGDPVSGVPVTFALAVENPARPPIVQTSLGDGSASLGGVSMDSFDGWSWADFFHVVGRQQIVASVAGAAPVNFDIEVTPSAHRYDGRYACLWEVWITNGLVSGRTSRNPISGQVDEATGALQIFVPIGISSQRYSGQIDIDPLGNASVLGTVQDYVAGHPFGDSKPWSCLRY